jgi:hypothetical protein
MEEAETGWDSAVGRRVLADTAESDAKSGLCEKEEAGVAETGCDSGPGESGAQQPGALQLGQKHAAHCSLTSAARTWTSCVQASSKLQTMTSAVLTISNQW